MAHSSSHNPSSHTPASSSSATAVQETLIHPTAIIAPGATLGAGVRVGAYSVVGPHVTLGDHVVLHSHVVVDGHTTLGEGTVVFPFASLGHAPQDLKFQGERTSLIIGKHNVIREHVTMNPGTSGGGGVTRVGDRCLFMASTHVAHDCQIGNQVILANNATLAGHVVVGDHVIIGGLAAVHQFVRIGQHAIIGGLAGVEHDVIPYGSVIGERGHLAGLNLVGLKRRGFSRERIHALRRAYKLLFTGRDAQGKTPGTAQGGTLAERAQQLAAEYAAMQEVMDVLTFIQAKSSRSLLTPKETATSAADAVSEADD